MLYYIECSKHIDENSAMVSERHYDSEKDDDLYPTLLEYVRTLRESNEFDEIDVYLVLEDGRKERLYGYILRLPNPYCQ